MEVHGLLDYLMLLVGELARPLLSGGCCTHSPVGSHSTINLT
jgi:hypothetical protein